MKHLAIMSIPLSILQGGLKNKIDAQYSRGFVVSTPDRRELLLPCPLPPLFELIPRLTTVLPKP